MTSLDLGVVAKAAKERFLKRYELHGFSPLSLGWDSTQSQQVRFRKLISAINFDSKSILDIGCGFGDLCAFLISEGIEYKTYLGWDIVEPFILEARNRFDPSRNNFELCDITSFEYSLGSAADISVMLGLLNWNLGSRELNIEYTQKMIQRAFDLAKECCAVDFLSSHLSPFYPVESNVFYHDPSEVIRIVSSLTSNFRILHDYPPIPQKEFMLILFK